MARFTGPLLILLNFNADSVCVPHKGCSVNTGCRVILDKEKKQDESDEPSRISG